ncbi:hypothetical protein CPC16_009127 [Podila verticillata]|nr:hypothetical protein BGZ52_001562 [Haplosporangium bisporale]KAF9382963.1 hypothetical protein CPC16_009127 [Podila verticillata]
MAWRCSGSSNKELVSLLAQAKLITQPTVENAMLIVDRGKYSRFQPYEDAPQTIGYGATISAPHMHASALEALSPYLFPGAKVLDIGSGSGYLTVCMAEMVGPKGHVVGVDHIPELVELAKKNTAKDHAEFLETGRVAFHAADGRVGFSDEAPYDCIHVGAAAASMHKELVGQLKAPGRMFIPVGRGEQAIYVVDKDKDGHVTQKKVMNVLSVKPCGTTGQNLVGLWRPSFTRVDQKLYLYGGGGHVTNDLHVLDLVTMNWDCVLAQDGVPPTKRYGHTAVLWDQYIIIFGGSNEYLEYRDDVIVFSLKTKVWSRPDIKGEVPARYLHSATVYKNKMYVYGGFAKDSKRTYVLEEMRMLNLETWTWSEAYQVPARYNHSASLIGNKLWIYAGKDEAGQTVSDLHSIDLDTLKVLPHIGITGKVVLLKSQHFSESIGNQLIVFGKYLNEFTGTSLYGLWIMDLEQLEWRKLDIDHCLEDGVWNYFTVVSKHQRSIEYGTDDCFIDTSDDRDDGGSAPSLIFLGNTEKERPQPYDHFRDVLSINIEFLGVFQIPPSTLQSHMSLMLNNEEFSDFCIISKGSQKIHVHRMVLSSRWPHFRNMHASGMIESTRGSIVLPEPYPVVFAFLKFLYTDSVDTKLDYSIVCEVMIMANMYLLERLKKLCASILHKHHLHIDTCVRIFQAACVSQEHGLKKLSQEFIFRHCGAVMKTEDWLLMWSQSESGAQRAALEEFIDGIPDEASLELSPNQRPYAEPAPFEPSLRKEL